MSEEALAQADYCAVIPMAGFVESFNISVAAALIMYEAHNQRLKKLGCNGDLSEEEQKLLVAALMLRSVVSHLHALFTLRLLLSLFVNSHHI